MRAAPFLLALLLAGCCGTSEWTRPMATGEPWDTTYLLDLDPDAVTTAELTSSVAAAEARLEAATVDGVVWARYRSDPTLAQPDRFTGGDSLLFTGIATATWAWKYSSTGDPADLARVLGGARGLHLLTHATGTPGVLCRQALPLPRAVEFNWPWPHRAPFTGERAGYGYYTRCTRDQVTGLVLGLAAAWRVLEGDTAPDAVTTRGLLREVGRHALDRLEADDWRIRNEHGENDTNADDVDGLLRLGLEGFVAVAEGGDKAAVRAELEDHLSSWWEGLTCWVNRFANADQYYANNLRATRSLSLAVLAPLLGNDLAELREHASSAWWRYVEDHRSAWFDAAWMALGGVDRSSQVLYSLRSLSLRPSRGWPSPYHGQHEAPLWFDVVFNCTAGYPVDPHLRKPTGYFTWQKAPWDTGELDPGGHGEDIGLSTAAAYWLWRWAGGTP